MKRERQIDDLTAGLTGLLAFGLYLRTLAPGVLASDSGEFQFAAWLGSLPHPTGYPLFVMLGYLWTHLLPWGSPAWRMNLLTAGFGGLAVALVFLLALRLLRAAAGRGDGIYRLPTFVAAATFAVTPTFWSQAVITEVYTLHTTLLAGILLALVAWGERVARDAGSGAVTPPYLLAALLGISLTHHRSVILLAPAILVYLVLVRPAGCGWRAYLAGLARAVPLVLLPLLVYLYIPLRAPLTPYQQIVLAPGQTLTLYQPTLLGFWQYITGQVFESDFRTPAAAVAQFPQAAGFLLHELPWPGLLLALAGLGWLIRRRSWPLLSLTGLLAAASLVFNLFYGIGDIFVYYIPIYLIACLWLGQGLVAIGALAPRLRGRVALAAVSLVSLALPVHLLAANYAQTDLSAATADGSEAQALLARPLPAGAILVTNDRDEMMPVWYEQYVEGRRPDLTGLFPQIVPGPAWSDVGAVVQGALDSGRPVYLTKPMPGLEIKFNLANENESVRVVGPAAGKAPEHARVITFGDAVTLAGYNVQPAMLQAGGTVTVTLYWQPKVGLAQNYTSFVHLVNAAGQTIGQDDHRPGGVYYPSSLWRPGERLADAHGLKLAADLGRPPYQIVAGLYRQVPALEHLGKPEAIGYLAEQQAAAPVPAAAAITPVAYGNQLALVGREVSAGVGGLKVRLYWQALAALDHDYTLFVHVVDAAGKIVAQLDTPPAGGSLPATASPAGYVFAQDFAIPRPAGLPAGRYRLEYGAYDPATLVALPPQPAGGGAIGEIDW